MQSNGMHFPPYMDFSESLWYLPLCYRMVLCLGRACPVETKPNREDEFFWCQSWSISVRNHAFFAVTTQLHRITTAFRFQSLSAAFGGLYLRMFPHMNKSARIALATPWIVVASKNENVCIRPVWCVMVSKQ